MGAGKASGRSRASGVGTSSKPCSLMLPTPLPVKELGSYGRSSLSPQGRCSSISSKGWRRVFLKWAQQEEGGTGDFWILKVKREQMEGRVPGKRGSAPKEEFREPSNSPGPWGSGMTVKGIWSPRSFQKARSGSSSTLLLLKCSQGPAAATAHGSLLEKQALGP